MVKKKVKNINKCSSNLPEDLLRRLPIKLSESLALTVEGDKLVYVVKEDPTNPVSGMTGIMTWPVLNLTETQRALIREIEEKLKKTTKTSTRIDSNTSC